MVKIRPFLKWAGSKYNCLQEIISALPQGQRLIEPFAGSGVIFMNTNFSSYLLAESNLDLIHIFNHLKNDGTAFINYCQKYFLHEMNCPTKYYEIRSAFNFSKCSSRKKSAFFLYLNRHGYNGLCRYNSKGIYNVPFGLHKKPYFPQQEMVLFHQKSQCAQFVHADFRKTFMHAIPGDIIYCDPPYVPYLKHTQTLAYNKLKFSEEDHLELACLAEQTAARGIPVIISNHNTPFTRHCYQTAQVKTFPVARWISCQAHNRKPVEELLALFMN